MTNKKSELRLRIIFGVLCVLAFIIGALWITMTNKAKSLEWPELKSKDVINDKVASIEIERSFGRITFESGARKTIYFARNHSYAPNDLAFFLQKDDHFQKKTNNDTITITRDNVSYIFVLGKEIQCCKNRLK